MKKRISLMLLCLVCSLIAIFGLTGCHDEPHTHKPKEAVHENEILATCTRKGSYDEVIRCSVCNEIISSKYKKTEKLSHNYNAEDICSICGRDRYTKGLKYTLDSSTDTYIVTGIGTATDTEINIAPVYNGKPVTSIGDKAFRGCRSLASIEIPDSVTSIGSEAFYYCESLTGIEIPDSVTSIGNRAFIDCKSLISITVPDSVTSLGYDAFSNTAYYNDEANWENGVLYIDKHLQKAKRDISGDYAIKSGTLTIADYAFERCKSITSITIPDSVISIGNDAFYKCDSLTNITIPNSVTSIGERAFVDCSSLTSITLPDNVISISYGAFWGCNNLTSIAISDNVISISYGAFSECDNLTGITIPNNVTSIGEIAFAGCNSLTSITIPDTVTSIGERAFYMCNNLASIIIPNSVTIIEERTFDLCDSLTSIYFKGTMEDWEKIEILNFNDTLQNATRYYYSETEPELNSDGTAYNGNYWHYVDGKVTIWIKEK